MISNGKEGMSKLKFACHLFLFRYGIIKRILTHPLLSFSDLHRKSVVFRTELANRYGSLPHLALTQRFQLCIQFLTIVGLRVAVDRNLGFVTRLNALLQLLHHRLDSIVERAHPVESTALGSSRAVGIHPVHTVLCKQRHQ